MRGTVQPRFSWEEEDMRGEPSDPGSSGRRRA